MSQLLVIADLIGILYGAVELKAQPIPVENRPEERRVGKECRL